MAHATTGIPPPLARVMRREIEAFSRAIGRASRGAEDGVHRARVASRRLREHLPILAAMTGGDCRELEREVRRVTRALGGVREMDVARRVLREGAEAAEWSPPVVARVDRACARTRRRREKVMIEQIEAPAARALAGRLADVVATVATPASRSAAAVVISARLKQRAKSLVRELDAAGTMYAIEPLHRVRIAAKKLRYTLELARPAAGVAAARELRQIKELQVRLGDLHDVQVLQEHVLAAASKPGLDRPTTRQLAEFSRGLETRCRELHAKYLKAAPSARQLADRLPADFALRLVKPRRSRMARMSAPAAPPIAVAGHQ